MDQKQFAMAIEQLCVEKGISREKVIETIEAALALAYKKDYGKKGQIIRVKFDEKTGGMEVSQIKIVAEENTEEEDEKLENLKIKEEKEEKETKKKFNPEKNITIEEAKKYKKNPKIGDEIEISLPTHSDFGRIAAQTAKQVIIQKIREAEKEAVYDEYKGKEGEVFSGTIQRIEGSNVFVDIGRTAGILFPTEQIPGEHYRIGQRLKVCLLKVEEDMKNTGLIFSRTHPNMVSKLFEVEVPEIASGSVEIKSVAREPGSRAKIAVVSNEEGVDPIGSCVGQNGSRIQMIINELNNEKIDIIEWSEDPIKFIKNAMSPAKINYLEINEENKSAIVYVNPDQFSLAIGKKGQNVRLAAKLTGWKIDIMDVEKSKEKETEDKDDNKDDNEKDEDEDKDKKEEKKESSDKKENDG